MKRSNTKGMSGMLRPCVAAVAFLLYLPSFAVAQAAPSTALAALPDHSKDVSNCDAYYPQQEFHSGIDGETILSVHVSKSGELSKISVSESSGNSGLDAAAITCAEQARLPQTSDGQPVDIDWQASVPWKHTRHNYIFLPKVFACPIRAYPMSAVQSGENGAVTIFFSIGGDGNPTDGRVVQSTNCPDLDAAALSCLSYWHFASPTQNGQPIKIDKEFRIVFKMTVG